MLTAKQIESYNQVRLKNARNIICHAPFTSLNFEQNGNVSACCYNRSFSLGKIPDQSIDEIWKGSKANELRTYIKNNDLSGGCSACSEVIQSGNYQGTKAIYYDEFAPKNNWLENLKNKFQQPAIQMPRLFEFELSNSCNLECIMCNGYFSSSIRKNREQLPPIKNHYGDEFVEQLIPYLPYLTDVKFLGGEPFLIDIYYKIWDKIIQINPKIKVHITTNGSILNKKTKKYLEQLNAGIIVSIESLNKENYEAIRINANLEEVLQNVEYFIQYTQTKNTYLSFAICPIIQNRYDMPDLLKFCNSKNIHIHFNTVWTPESTSLRFLEYNELQKVIEYYSDFTFENRTNIQKENNEKLNDFIAQLKAWLSEAEAENSSNESLSNWELAIQSIDLKEKDSNKILFLESNHYKDKLTNDSNILIQSLKTLHQQIGSRDFINLYIENMNLLAREVLNQNDLELFKTKTSSFLEITNGFENLNNLSEELIRTGFIFQINFFHQTNLSQMESLVKNRFQ
ncbi:MAG TPA: twitch domain-containing radical SAM protein [Chitinophagales bacterium]|nr:twitch domain-containing radical SAM protein [Chitinophagales bacterium]